MCTEIKMINLDEAVASTYCPPGYSWEIHFELPTKFVEHLIAVEEVLLRHGIVIANINNLDEDISYCQAFSSDYNFGLVKTLECAFGYPAGLKVTEYKYLGASCREYTDKENDIYRAFMLHLINNVFCNWEDAITQVNALYPEQPRDKVRFVGERIRRQVAGIENEK